MYIMHKKIKQNNLNIVYTCCKVKLRMTANRWQCLRTGPQLMAMFIWAWPEILIGLIIE